MGLVAPVAGLFHAAEGHALIAPRPVVDEDLAGFETMGHAHDAADVLAPEPRRQSEITVIGQRQRLLFGLETEDRQHRPEDFLTADHHLGRDAIEDHRTDEQPRPGNVFAAGTQHRPLLDPLADVAHHALMLGAVDHRPHEACRVQRVARLHALGSRHHLGDEGVADRVFHQQAGTGDADLPLVVEDGGSGTLRHAIQIRAIGEHDVGALATALQEDTLQVRLSGILHQLLADGGGTGEGQTLDVHRQGQRTPDGMPEARQHLEDATRETCLTCECRQTQR